MVMINGLFDIHSILTSNKDGTTCTEPVFTPEYTLVRIFFDVVLAHNASASFIYIGCLAVRLILSYIAIEFNGIGR